MHVPHEGSGTGATRGYCEQGRSGTSLNGPAQWQHWTSSQTTNTSERGDRS